MSAPDPARPPGRAVAVGDALPRTRPFALLGSELQLLFRRRRTWAMLAALALVPILIAVAVRVTSIGDSGRGPAFLGSITDNGLFVSFTALTVSIPLFLPLTVGVVSGDAIAGEANTGTLRYLLAAPVGRLRLLGVKFAAILVWLVAASAVIVIAGAVIGAILFPVGPVTLLSGDRIDGGEYLIRCLLLVGYAALSLTGLGAVGLFISTLTNVPIGAMTATVVLAGASQIVDALPQLEAIAPFVFSHHWFGFGDLLRQPVDYASYADNAVLQLGWVVVAAGLAIGRFTTKDVLS
jgi:ABC-2 type transport system permease protein